MKNNPEIGCNDKSFATFVDHIKLKSIVKHTPGNVQIEVLCLHLYIFSIVRGNIICLCMKNRQSFNHL